MFQANKLTCEQTQLAMQQTDSPMSAMTLAGPVLVTPCGSTCLMIKTCISCPICSTYTY